MLRVGLFGPLSVEVDGRAVPDVAGLRPPSGLAWLLLCAGPHARPRAAALFWPGVLDTSARAPLRSALWTIRAALDAVTRYIQQWPGFAYPTEVRARDEPGGVTISCLLSDIRHEWTLSPAPARCLVKVRAELPETETERLEHPRHELQASLPRLVAAAEQAAGVARLR